MRFTFSNNPLDRFSCWLANNINEPLSRLYYRKKKSHYECSVCGQIIAPYFYIPWYSFDKNASSITCDYGWHKFKDSNRWICHHCADHGFAPSSYNGTELSIGRGRTWDEWQEYVKKENEQVLDAIKEKDPEYYHYWFEGGREQELFGNGEDDD